MDSAFATAPYPSMTTRDLIKAIGESADFGGPMAKEVERRLKVMQGDVSVMTQGERLRFVATGKAR